jgi:hypothetical protein
MFTNRSTPPDARLSPSSDHASPEFPTVRGDLARGAAALVVDPDDTVGPADGKAVAVGRDRARASGVVFANLGGFLMADVPELRVAGARDGE